MSTRTISIATGDGERTIEGATIVRRLVAVHKPDGRRDLPGWSVTHLRTGLNVGIDWLTKAEALAFAHGFARVLTLIGDDGEWGNGDRISNGAKGRAVREYIARFRRLPREMMTRADAIACAERAVEHTRG